MLFKNLESENILIKFPNPIILGGVIRSQSQKDSIKDVMMGPPVKKIMPSIHGLKNTYPQIASCVDIFNLLLLMALSI